MMRAAMLPRVTRASSSALQTLPGRGYRAAWTAPATGKFPRAATSSCIQLAGNLPARALTGLPLDDSVFCGIATAGYGKRHVMSMQAVSNRVRPTSDCSSSLEAIFAPKSVAVVGATDRPGSVGRTIMANLISASEGRIKLYPINPTRPSVQKLPCVKSLSELPVGAVDLVVMVTPAASCVEVMRQCAAKKVKSVIVISAGFKEAGPEGARMEKELIDIARSADIRVIGPNCLGVMSPVHGLNASFAATTAKPGPLAFISQSGAMCTAVLDWSLEADVGFSAFVSVGSMADVDWGDLIQYLDADDSTRAIMIYMESVGNAQSFMQAAQKVGCHKPIVVIKSGKTEAAAKAAASHTGSLAGSYASFTAAMDRVGAMAVDTIGELFNVAYFLAKQPSPEGPNLVIVTNAGGPAVLATDATVSHGAKIADISADFVERLNKFLPAAWSHSNPVDILGDASAELYAKTLEVVLTDPKADGVLVVLSPQDVTDPTGTAKQLVGAVQKLRKEGQLTKPVFASWMGGKTVAEGARILSDAGIPSFANADDAAATFAKLYKQRARAKTVAASPSVAGPAGSASSVSAKAKNLLNQVRTDGRSLLTEAESKKLLTPFGINCVPTVVARTREAAQKAAQELSSKYEKFAIKLNSETITHKADVGGVKLNVAARDVGRMFDEIRDSVTSMHSHSAFQGVTVQPMIDLSSGLELILGSTVDPQFGPLVMFGAGGTMVEVFQDTALGVPPFDQNGALELMKQTKIFKALKGMHGKRFPGVDLRQLSQLVSNFSNMTVALQKDVAECDINPLLASTNDVIALDARIVLRH